MLIQNLSGNDRYNLLENSKRIDIKFHIFIENLTICYFYCEKFTK